jgi:N-acetylated-alpha-linked acidic dipeptidase
MRSFGVALRHGWQPHRTLIFASWEGEEFDQVGSMA